MAFTAGIKRPQAQTGTGYQQNSFDRLVTVTGYDLEKKILFAEDQNQRKYEVHINREDYTKAEESVLTKGLDVGTIKWMGHDINRKMEKANPIGSKVILQKTIILKKDNGEGYALTEASRVIGVPNPEADKTFQGLFSLSYRRNEDGNLCISRVRHWHPTNAIDINDETTIMQLKAEIDEAVSHHGTHIGEHNVTVPTMGIQMRALMKKDAVNPKDGSPIYEAFDSSINFDWIKTEDEDGRTKGHPLTGDEMLAIREGYIQYIQEHALVKGREEDVKIEICPYRVYPASKNKNLLLTFGVEHRDVHADKNPLFQLSHRQSYVDYEQTEMVEGVNYAVNGIIQISGNRLEKVNGRATEIPSYWVNNVHANHIKGHIFAFLRTSEGYKVEVHPNLQLLKNISNKADEVHLKEDKRQEENNTGNSKGAEKIPSAMLLEDDFDPFAPSSKAVADIRSNMDTTKTSIDSYIEDDFDPFAPTTNEEKKPSATETRAKTPSFNTFTKFKK